MSAYHREPAPPPLFAAVRAVNPAPIAARIPNASLAIDAPPRSTRKQSTRWDTQDAAYLAASAGAEQRIMNLLRERPSTCDECEARLELLHQSCSAAINKLMRLGFIVANGSRKTRSGRLARIWEVR